MRRVVLSLIGSLGIGFAGWAQGVQAQVRVPEILTTFFRKF